VFEGTALAGASGRMAAAGPSKSLGRRLRGMWRGWISPVITASSPRRPAGRCWRAGGRTGCRLPSSRRRPIWPARRPGGWPDKSPPTWRTFSPPNSPTQQLDAANTARQQFEMAKNLQQWSSNLKTFNASPGAALLREAQQYYSDPGSQQRDAIKNLMMGGAMSQGSQQGF
jgi:hypothetical protein